MRRPSFPIRTGPMLGLGFALALWFVVSALRYVRGDLSLPAHIALSSPALYFLCICVHDGVHGVLARPRALNQWVSGAFALLLTMPFPLLQHAHLRHHRRTGEADDPEHVIYSAELWQLPFRLLVVPLYYLRSARALPYATRGAMVGQLAATAIVVALGGQLALAAWLLPLLLAVSWFGFTTVYVPHSRYADRLMPWLAWHSGWHADHHFDVRYPYPQYVEVRVWRITRGLASASRRERRALSWLATHLW